MHALLAEARQAGGPSLNLMHSTLYTIHMHVHSTRYLIHYTIYARQAGGPSLNPHQYSRLRHRVLQQQQAELAKAAERKCPASDLEEMLFKVKA